MTWSIKNILIWLMAIIVVGYLIGMGIWSSRRANTQVCPAVEISIMDFDKRQYVTEAELINLLKDKGL